MSETLETDKIKNEIGKSGIDWHYSATLMTRHANDLEKRLNICRQARDHAVSMEENMRILLNETRAELAATNAEIARVHEAMDYDFKTIQKLKAEIADLKYNVQEWLSRH